MNVTSMLMLPQTELCRQNGHATCQLHTVRSEDGYLLKVVRIPAAAGAVPVLLLHGDLASSDSWMMRKDKSNLGAFTCSLTNTEITHRIVGALGREGTNATDPLALASPQ